MQTHAFEAPMVPTQHSGKLELRLLSEQVLSNQRVEFHPELPPLLLSNDGRLYAIGFCCRVTGFKRPSEGPQAFNPAVKQRRGSTGRRIAITNTETHTPRGGWSSGFDLCFPPALVKTRNRPSQRRRTNTKPAADLRFDDMMLRISIRQRRQGQLPVEVNTKDPGNPFPFTFSMPLHGIPQPAQVNIPAPQQVQPQAGAPTAAAGPTTSSRDPRKRPPAASIPKPVQTYEAMVIEPSPPLTPFTASSPSVLGTVTSTSSDYMDTEEPWQKSAPPNSKKIETHEAMVVDPAPSTPTPRTRLALRGAPSTSAGATTSYHPRFPPFTPSASVTAETRNTFSETLPSDTKPFSSASSAEPSGIPPATHYRPNAGILQQCAAFPRWVGSATSFPGPSSPVTRFPGPAYTPMAPYSGSKHLSNRGKGSAPTFTKGASTVSAMPTSADPETQHGGSEAAPMEAEDESEDLSTSEEDGFGDSEESGDESGDEASDIDDDDGADVHEGEGEDEDRSEGGRDEEEQDEGGLETSVGDEESEDAEHQGDEDEDQDAPKPKRRLIPDPLLFGEPPSDGDDGLWDAGEAEEDEVSDGDEGERDGDLGSDDPLLSTHPPSSDDEDDDEDGDVSPTTSGTSKGTSAAGRAVNFSSRDEASDSDSDDSDSEEPAQTLGLAAQNDLKDLVEDFLEETETLVMRRMQERSSQAEASQIPHGGGVPPPGADD